MAKPATAKETYSSKVCETYLGISKANCEAAFDKLISNMKSGLKAMR